MSEDRIRREKIARAFEEAVDLAVSEREECVREVCEGDALCIQGAMELLEAEVAAGDFLEGKPILPALPETPMPEKIGPYRVVEKLGFGGMGAVYRAERDDGEMERCVAIKVLRHRPHGDEDIERLRHERQILANLKHPGIAHLYDGGTTEEGFPYLVMEFIDGMRFGDFCIDQGLDLRERLDLFLQICDAVAEAHRRFVVHLDIKPSNIMVTRDGQVKLLDFGIARILESESGREERITTEWGRVREMTPPYASPEQISGTQVTTASDVFSLGVVLYELLSGDRPFDFDGMTTEEMKQAFQEQELPPPSQSDRSALADLETLPVTSLGERRLKQRTVRMKRGIQGDLDAITLKALSLEPEDRYSSVDRLADDLRRYLKDEPVTARQGNRFYHTAKLIRRNRGTSLALAVLFLVIISSVFILIEQRDIARAERSRAELEQSRAESVLGFVSTVLENADPSQSRGEKVTIVEALETVDERLLALSEHPSVEATLRTTIGRILLNLGRSDEARLHFEKVVSLRRETVGEDGAEYASALSDLGTALRDLRDYDQATGLTKEALTLMRRIHARSDHRPELLQILNDLTTLYCYRETYDDAVEPSIEALALAEAIESEDDALRAVFQRGDLITEPKLRERALQVGIAESNRATLLKHRPEEGLEEQEGMRRARDAYRRTLLKFESLWGEEHAKTAAIINNLGTVEFRLGNYAEAEALHRRTLKIRQKLYEQSYHIAQSLAATAKALKELGNLEEAAVFYRDALDEMKKNGLENADPTSMIQGRLEEVLKEIEKNAL